jgi:hypothetical protein
MLSVLYAEKLFRMRYTGVREGKAVPEGSVDRTPALPDSHLRPTSRQLSDFGIGIVSRFSQIHPNFLTLQSFTGLPHGR